MTIWVLIIVCINSIWCSAGSTWQTDKVYASRSECEQVGKIRARRGEAGVCLEGNMEQK